MKKTNRRISSLLLLLLAAMALLAFGVFTNVLTDIWGHNIKAAFQNNPVLIAGFALLLGVVGYLYSKIENRSKKTAPESVDKGQYDEAFGKFKELLKAQYQIRLNSKTGRRLPINLTAKSTHFGMAPERVEAFFKDKDLTIESENIASEIDKILKTNDRLLLIGDPGAGKTTILLYAAINILNRSYSSDDSESSDELQKLPLILNLATWRKGRDFAEWYAQNIAHSYSLSPVFMQELLLRNAVVPFFDGFDEVAEKYRDDCFQKMAAYFGDEKRKQLIVSSRKKEYAAAETDAPVYAEIEVQPLSLAQIKKALSENAHSQAADRALLYALEHDRWLAEAVETPFYLNTASFLFGKSQRTLADFPFKADSTEGRQTELVKTFVDEQVPEEQDKKYLHFLAERMEQESFLVFELLSMQPEWGRNVWRYRLVLGWAYGLVGGVTFSFIDRYILGLVFGWFIGFLWVNYWINTSDIQIWSWQEFKKNREDGLVEGLIFGALGLAFSLGLSLNYEIDYRVAFGLNFALITSLKDAGIVTSYFLHVFSPYQRFWFTFKLGFWEMPSLVISITVGLLAYWVQTENLILHVPFDLKKFGLMALLVFPTLLFIPILRSNFIKHFSLRLVLYLEGKMPLRVVTFMDRMTDQHIFEDNRRTNKKGKKMRGATWRFRHKILQDYFAGLR